LSYFLLLLITYGVTVEVAQNHAPVSRNHPNVAAFGDAGAPQSSDKGRSHQAECPMCQFQQQLFSSLVYVPLLVLTPSIRLAFVSTPPGIHLSTAAIPTSGRAPPRG
jgi:Protein of unknown function (DUF2946)